MHPISRGLWAGNLATGPMTMALFAMHRLLPRKDQRPLPPATLTEDVVEKSGFGSLPTHDQRTSLTMLLHFGFGAACGAIYSLLARKGPARPLVHGITFGLGVWTFSYLGWIPGFSRRSSAPGNSAPRNLLMILAHVVWGATLGYSEHELRERSGKILDSKARSAGASD